MTAVPRRRRRRAMNDAELMAAVSSGETGAMGELYDRYADRAYSVALAVCEDDRCAQEVVRAVFASLWQRRTDYERQRGTVAAWLLSAAHSAAIQRVRESASAPRYRADRLAQLPDPQQQVITLAYFGQLSHTEIAAHLGLDTATVKGHMRLGLRQLQDSLGPAEA